MKFWITIFLSIPSIFQVDAGGIEGILKVRYRPEIILGEKCSAEVTLPRHVFFTLAETFYAPNGTSTTTLETGNAFNWNATFTVVTDTVDLNPNETCIERTSLGIFSTALNHRPDSAGNGWGYSFMVKLYYSTGYGYRYYTNSTTGKDMVCITSPYISEELKTDRYNITVKPASNGATTTRYPATASIATQFEGGMFNIENWPLSPPAMGQSFSSAGRTIPLHWVWLLPTMLATFPVLFSLA